MRRVASRLRCCRLAGKILLPLALSGLGVALLLSWEGERSLQRSLHSEALKRGETVVTAIEHAADVTDANGLRRLVTSLGASREVDTIVVLAGSPLRTVASTRLSWLGLPPERLPESVRRAVVSAQRSTGPPTATDAAVVARQFRFRLGTTEVQRAPGLALVHIGLEQIHQEVAGEVRRRTAIAILAMLLMVVGALLLIQRVVLRPVLAIGRVLGRREGGDNAARVDLLPSDELGDLARELNSAFAALEERERRLAASNCDLERERDYASALVASLQNGVIVVSSAGILIQVNERFCNMMGLAREEAVGARMPFGWWPPEERELIGSRLEEMLAAGGGVAFGLHFMRTDGTRLPVDISAAPLRASGEGGEGFIVTITDAAERRRAEERLEESEERNRALVETAVDAIITIDDRGRIASANPAAERLFGWPVSEIAGENVSMLMPEPDRSAHDGYISRYLTKGDPRIIGRGRRVVGLRRDGSTFPMHLSVGEMRVGERRLFTGIVRDETESVAAERRLQESEERFRAIYARAPVGIFETDAHGACTSVNERWCEMTGWNKEAALGSGWRAILHPDDLERLDAERAKDFAAGREHTGEYRYITPHGAVVWVSSSTTTLRDDSGAVTGFIGTLTDVTPRRRAEEDLARERDRLEGILVSLADGICMLSPDGAIVSVNPRLCEMTGLAPERLVGRRLPHPFWPSDDVASVGAEFRAMLRLGRGERDFTFQRADGSRFPAIVSLSEVRDDSDTIIAYVASVKDVTERAGMELALRRARQNLARAQEIAHLGSWEWNIATDVLSWSDEAYRIFGIGLQQREATFGALLERVHTDDRELVREAITTAIEKGAPYDIEHRVVRPSGEERVVHEQGEVTYASDGSPLHLLGTVLDITERKHAEEAVERLSRQTRSILNSAGEGIFGVDADDRVLFLNPAAAAMLGWEADELIGRAAHDVIHAVATHGDGADAPCPACVAYSDDSTRRLTGEVFRRRDGAAFPVDCAVSPLRDQGQTRGAVVIFSDISERQAVERMKDEFVSVVSHELRTPLTAIRGSLGLLASGKIEGPQAHRMVEMAVSNTDRLVRLINDILDIERIESGRVTMDLQPCDAADLMRQSIEVMEGLATKAGVVLLGEPEECVLMADPDRVIQTLTNLLSNAIKFSSPGGRVWLSAGRSGDDLVFEVRDEGRGIPGDKLETIFGRFQQVDASDSREKDGTGLGLAICRSIAEQHGGRIWVESEVGRGSIFSVALPVVEVADGPIASPDSSTPVRGSERTPVPVEVKR